ncbi:hypothetical protein NA57DRAFT_59071 [Rhizodiscina lignyota]|uniref:F-box domain-containing protein n=1 Tax=Rhizodiscina lignyota TaxID=1504668 RepID=A0A9P4M669_9PEZI|nr:hypothetical protein NA57DRAFT_59071 [Rhizodiscina lignyota]
MRNLIDSDPCLARYYPERAEALEELRRKAVDAKIQENLRRNRHSCCVCLHCSPTHMHAFPFGRLPTELQLEVLRYLIPTGLKLEFQRRFKRSRGGRLRPTDPAKPFDYLANYRRSYPSWALSALLRASHSLYQQAMTVLYGENIVVFRIATNNSFTAYVNRWVDDTTASLPPTVLRFVKNIELVFESKLCEYPRFRRVHNSLENFVRALADGPGLTSLRVKMVNQQWMPPPYPSCEWRDRLGIYVAAVAKEDENTSYWQYALEPLVSIRGVQRVEIQGVNGQFAKKLKHTMESQPGTIQLKPQLYCIKSGYKRERVPGRWKARKGKRVMYTRTTKQYYEPEYNWDEYDAV